MLRELIKKRKENKAAEYRLYRNTIIFQDAVRWMGRFFPVLEEVEKLMSQDSVMTMTRRLDIMERCGVGGLSLAQLIGLNELIHEQLAIYTGWSTCQLEGDIISPIAYSAEIDPLFIVDVYNQRMSVPTITIYVGQITDLGPVQRSVEKFLQLTRSSINTVIGPKIIVTMPPKSINEVDKPFKIENLNKTSLPRIRQIRI